MGKRYTQYVSQTSYIVRLQTGYSLYDGRALLLVRIGLCQALKLGYCFVPGERPRRKARKILLFDRQSTTILESYLNTTGHTCGKTSTQLLIGLNNYSTQQALYIFTNNPVGRVLCRQDLTIQPG